MIKYLETLKPSFWEKLIHAVIDAISSFASNQEAQSKFFTTAERLLRDNAGGQFTYTDQKTLLKVVDHMSSPRRSAKIDYSEDIPF